jgi:outer membrane cobalamin receptor
MKPPATSLLLVGSLLTFGCAHGVHHDHAAVKPIGLFIDAERIQRSGGATAWDVLKREAPVMTFREDRNGQPSRLGRRGRTSILLQDSPLVFLDGVRMEDFRVLADLPAATLQDIWVLNGIDGTTYYGTDAVAGVILVRTKKGAAT